jgi:hypothetical protein
MQTAILIEALIEQTRHNINAITPLENEPVQALGWRSSNNTWNVLECLEHLNLYGAFYLPQIKLAIQNSNTIPAENFKSSFLGAYFAKSMLPKNNLNKMKTFKSKNPIHKILDKTVIQTFLQQQLQLVDLLHASRRVNLQNVKIKTTLSGLLKLNLGDTFQFIINHNVRHIQQIENILLQVR